MGGQLEMAFHMSVRVVCDADSLDARTWNLLIEDRFIPKCSEFGGFSTAREIQWFPHTPLTLSCDAFMKPFFYFIFAPCEVTCSRVP